MTATTPASAAGALTALVRYARATDRLGEAVELLVAASRLRPSFDSTAGLPGPPRQVLLSDGDDGATPVLVCIPSFLAGSGPHQFVRLAASFRRRLRTVGIVLPGFDPGSPVPGSWDVAVDALAAAVRAATVPGAPYLLLGHSIGGVVAYAVARRLDATAPARGVVLVDTLDPGPRLRDASVCRALESVLDRDAHGTVVTDESLLAMGAYLRVFPEWRHAELATPVLSVRAEIPFGSGVQAWPVAGTGVSVPADHFSVLNEDVGSTAAAVEAWLTGDRAAGPVRV